MWFFLSRRLRTWLLFAFVMPFVGRLLETAGGRVGTRNPRAGELLRSAGGFARTPATRRQRRQARRGL
jgi:hypothetical protein